MAQQLADLEKRLRASPHDYGAARAVLDHLTEHPARASALEKRAALSLALHHAGRLGDSVWDMYERAFLAALDCGDKDSADVCLRALFNRFGKGSDRVDCLRAAQLDAENDPRKALELLEAVLARTPGYPTAMKRKEVGTVELRREAL